MTISISCRTIDKTDSNDNLSNINGNTVSSIGNIADASIILADDENIYLTHRVSSPMLSRFSIDNDSVKLEDRYITVGTGPNEMATLMLNSASPNGEKIVFNDPNSRKAIEFNCLNDSISDNRQFLCERDGIKVFRFAVGHPLGTLITYTSNSDTSTDGVVGLVSATDSAFISLNGIGPDDMRNLSLSKQFYYAPNCQVFVQPRGSKCLFVSNNGQYAEVFEIDKTQAINKKILVDDVPSFSIDEHGRIAAASDDLKFGFKACVTSNRIYLAPIRVTYSERQEGLRNNPKYVGAAQGPDFVNEIWVYDWSGNSIGKYRLSTGISSFRVSTSGILWATTEDENYDARIMNYDLSNL
jgi:hypothetical protein